MEKRDIELIQKYVKIDNALAGLYREHVDFEKKLEKLENKSYLTPEEQNEIKAIKKKKLSGRDQIEFILQKYRSQKR